MKLNKYTEDDYCDIYANRICDNCGDCLKEYGVDLRAIRIWIYVNTLDKNLGFSGGFPPPLTNHS